MDKEQLVLGSFEVQIKKFPYLSVSSKDHGGDTKNNLIITTSRVIIESTNKNGFTRDEIPIDSVDRVESKFVRIRSKALGIFILFIGILILIAGGITLFLDQPLPVYVPLFSVGGLLSLISILVLLFKKAKQSFTLTFYTRDKFNLLANISADTFSSRRKKTKKNTNVKIITNVTAEALKMLNEVHGIVIDVKRFNKQIECVEKLVYENKITRADFDEHYQEAIMGIKR